MRIKEKLAMSVALTRIVLPVLARQVLHLECLSMSAGVYGTEIERRNDLALYGKPPDDPRKGVGA